MMRMISRRTLFAWPAMLAAHAQQPQPAAIGSRLELMVDRFLIERLSGAANRRLHHPSRENIALEHDAPWEGSGTGYHTVFQDGRLYRMYYKAWHLDPYGKTPRPVRIAYAESTDGIHWTKPDLGLVEFQGSRHNNLLLDQVNGGECHDFSPFLDPTGTVKYRAIGFGRKPRGLYAFHSNDGIQWVLSAKEPVITEGAFDTQNITFWDAGVAKYRVYLRDFHDGKRGIKTALSSDFLHWTKPEWLDYPGAPDEQLYTNQIRPYYRAPHLLIGFPSRYTDRGWIPATAELPEADLRRQRSQTNLRYGSAVTDALFMSSRDGRSFHRWNEAFLRPGLRTRDNWTYGDNYLAWHVVETTSPRADEARELSLYATESYFTGTSSRVRRYSLRIDGFASINASLDGGELLTKPFTFTGTKLLLNVSTSGGGSLRLELQDASGATLPGLRMEDSHVIFGDSLELAASWKGNPSLQAHQGRPVRLRVEVKDADLFALRFS